MNAAGPKQEGEQSEWEFLSWVLLKARSDDIELALGGDEARTHPVPRLVMRVRRLQ